MTKFCYLVQGETRVLRDFPYPRSDDLFVAAYDAPFELPAARECLHIPKTTWAEGRNILRQNAMAAGDYDYFVFCDDDVRFGEGDWERFEAHVRETRPALGVPLMSRASRNTLVLGGPVQRALIIDEQVMALHKSLMSKPGIAPLVTDYDKLSWFIGPMILETLLLRDHHPYVHQYNDVRIKNEVHRFRDNEESGKKGVSTYVAPTKELDQVRYVAQYFADRGEEFVERRHSFRRFRSRSHLWRQLVLRRLATDWRSIGQPC